MHAACPPSRESLPGLFPIIALDLIAVADVEHLLDSAFGHDRKTRTAYKLREGTAPIDALSFGLTDETGMLVGCLQSWPVSLVADHLVPMTLVGPVAVTPSLQRSGIGTRLMTSLLSAAAALRQDHLVMIGDPEYYGRHFGFSANHTQQWQCPGPVDRHRLLCRSRVPQALPVRGRIVPALAVTP